MGRSGEEGGIRLPLHIPFLTPFITPDCPPRHPRKITRKSLRRGEEVQSLPWQPSAPRTSQGGVGVHRSERPARHWPVFSFLGTLERGARCPIRGAVPPAGRQARGARAFSAWRSAAAARSFRPRGG